jgi:tRNA (cmo5U34)-methyltransferase
MKDAASARQTFEKIRSSVDTAPKPEIEDAPEWLNSIEQMQDFFNAIASGWNSVYGSEQPDPLYHAVATQIEATNTPIKVLILGCGTGLELSPILHKVPNAQITGIDIAPNMLAELQRKFSNYSTQIELIKGSYLDIPLGEQQFDYIIATLTTHHLSLDTKVKLYQRIHESLKPQGRYIEGDQSTDQEREQEILHWYNVYIAKLPGGAKTVWNYDVTLSPETQKHLLTWAGFQEIGLTWQSDDCELVVFVANK